MDGFHCIGYNRGNYFQYVIDSYLTARAENENMHKHTGLVNF